MSIVLFFLSAIPISAQTGGAIVLTDPAILEVGQGQVEGLNIILENAKDVYGIDVRASFDPTAVEVIDADQAKDGVQLVPGTFIQPDFMVRNTADNLKGSIQYVITQVNPTQPVSGKGIVLTIQFRGKGLGKQSTLKIDSVDIADRQGRKLTVTLQNGIIKNVQPKPPTPTLALTLSPTPTPKPARVQGAQAAQQTGTPEAIALDSKSASNSPSDSSSGLLTGNSMLDLLLIGISCGTFAGAFVLLAYAIVLLVQRRRRQLPPGAVSR